MFQIISVRHDEKSGRFVARNLITGTETAFDTAIFHTSRFLVTSVIVEYMRSAFPGNSVCLCSASVRKRMKEIVDFNALNDEV